MLCKTRMLKAAKKPSTIGRPKLSRNQESFKQLTDISPELSGQEHPLDLYTSEKPADMVRILMLIIFNDNHYYAAY